MPKSLTEMAVEITVAQASHARMSPEEVDQFLSVTFERLRAMKELEEGKPEVKEVVKEGIESLRLDPLKSVQRNKVICLECGRDLRQLSNAHLRSHGLTVKEYRRKWGLPTRFPLAAKTLVAKRKKVAREKGFGERLKKARAKGK